MCGRTCLTLAPDLLQKLCNVRGKWNDKDHYKPTYNFSPGNKGVIITSVNGKRVLRCMTWGITWKNKGKKEIQTINTTKERIEEIKFAKLSFNDKSKRCVIVSEGYYEWLHFDKTSPVVKQKRPQGYYFHEPNNSLVFFCWYNRSNGYFRRVYYNNC